MDDIKRKLTSRKFWAAVAEFVKAYYFGLSIAVLLPAYLQVDDIARHGPRHEHHELAFVGAVVGWNRDSHQRLSFSRYVRNGYVLEYG